MQRSRIGRALVALLGCVTLARGVAAEGFAPPDESLYAMGRFVYERNCLVCHGRWGDGDGELSKGMVPKPRKFSAGIFKYRSTPAGFLPTTEDLIHTVRSGRANTSMPYFTQLSDREVRAVVEFIKFFSPKWRKPENYAAPVKLPEPPVWLGKESETSPRVANGKATFALACASCHGELADGKGAALAELKDAWGDPAFPADLRLPAFRNGRTPADIFRVLTLGIHGTPMASFSEALTEEQRWELAAFIGTLRPPATARK
ncbi:MAG: c-type cytochrome [Limisphaerales bacterium]